LIYLEPETQRRVLSLLHFSLRDGGYLFLGNTESSSDSEHLFEVVNKKWRIFRRTGPVQPHLMNMPTFVPRSQSNSARLAEASADLTASTRSTATLLLQRALLERYGPPTVVVDRSDQVVYFHGATDPFLRHPAASPPAISCSSYVRPIARRYARCCARRCAKIVL
jgi:two-component system CheB/CheR fusion protein